MVFFLMQELIPENILPEEFLSGIKNSDYSSVRLPILFLFIKMP